MRKARAGLFISKDSHYTTELCRGAHEACKELGIELVTFFGGSLDAHIDYDSSSDYQKTVVFPYAKKLDVDFLVIPPNTICRTNDEIRERFMRQFDLPIITLNSQMEGFHFVAYDNKKGVNSAVSYMIENCKCQHIALVTAYREGITSKQRLEGYMEALIEHNIPYNEEYVVTSSGYASNKNNNIETLLKQHPEVDGVMCVTDSLAILVYDEIKKIGKRVGTDIKVAGFDDMLESAHMIPQLASCHADTSLLSYLGIMNGYQLFKENETKNQYLDAHFIPRMSVCCDSQSAEELAQFIDHCQSQGFDNDYIADGITQYIFDNKLVYSSPIKNYVTRLFLHILEIKVDDLHKPETSQMTSELIDEIFKEKYVKYLDLERFFQGFSIILDTEKYVKQTEKQMIQQYKQDVYSRMVGCYNALLIQKDNKYRSKLNEINKVNKGTMIETFENEYQSIEDNILFSQIKNAQFYTYEKPIEYLEGHSFIVPDHLVQRINIRDGKVIPSYNQKVPTKEILNLCQIPHRIITSIYSQKYQYGILITDMSFYELPTLEYLSIQFGISLHIKSIMNQLNDSSITDELTGIYNRRGIIQGINELYKDLKEDENIYLFLADLDNLKFINDHYGHDNGDNAIILVKDILKSVFDQDAIVGRLGGDEFIVVLKTKGCFLMTHLEENIQEKTEYYNKIYQYPYYVSFSYGISVFDHDRKNVDLNEVIRLADQLMYERKRKKHQ